MNLTESQIEQALRSFNVEKVVKYMVATGWRWAFAGEVPRVPRSTEVLAEARRLLGKLSWENGVESTHNIATGGLHASLVLDLEGQPCGAHVAFEIAGGYVWWSTAECEAEQKGD